MISKSVFIGLGANLNEPVKQLQQALCALKKLPETELLACSSLYSSAPLGPSDQPEYVNAVAEIETELTPTALLAQLQHIEQVQGRQRKAERWGPRTLDLDIILFGDLVLKSEQLTIPHYHFHAREFVLYPLLQIAPELVLPDGSPLSELVTKVPKNGLTELIPVDKLSIA